MSSPKPLSLADLRSRRDQEFDGEAHLTNEELTALLDAVEAMKRHHRRLLSRRELMQEPTWLPQSVTSALAKFEDPPWRR